MNYVYYIVAKAAHPGKHLPEYSHIIDEAMKYFNDRSMYARNPKKIDSLAFNKNSMSITLCSTVEIDTNHISRALRVFTEYLIEHAEDLIYNKRILHIRAVSNTLYKDLESEISMSDEEMLTALLHHVLHPSKEGEDLIFKIKSMLAEMERENNED